METAEFKRLRAELADLEARARETDRESALLQLSAFVALCRINWMLVSARNPVYGRFLIFLVTVDTAALDRRERIDQACRHVRREQRRIAAMSDLAELTAAWRDLALFCIETCETLRIPTPPLGETVEALLAQDAT